MQVLTWAHKRHRLLLALGTLDGNVAARVSSLETMWTESQTLSALAPTDGDTTPLTPQRTVHTPAVSTKLAQAAAAVDAAKTAALMPAKPQKGENIEPVVQTKKDAPIGEVPVYLQ